MSSTKDRHTGRKILKSPLKLIGAKTRIRDLLYQFFPTDYTTFIEPFMGTAGMTIGYQQSGVREVVGDLNAYAINFFKVLQQRPEMFWFCYQQAMPGLHLRGKEFFEFAKKAVVHPDTDSVMRSVYFYVITKVCMNGIWRLNKAGECNSSYCGQTHARGWMDREWFDLVVERIKNIHFYHNGYENIRFAPVNSFVFVDPPYHDCKTTYNGISFGDRDFEMLESDLRLINHHSKWLLTINDNLFIRGLFKNWCILQHDVHYSCSQTTAGRGKKPELLIANYDLDEVLMRRSKQ